MTIVMVRNACGCDACTPRSAGMAESYEVKAHLHKQLDRVAKRREGDRVGSRVMGDVGLDRHGCRWGTRVWRRFGHRVAVQRRECCVDSAEQASFVF